MCATCCSSAGSSWPPLQAVRHATGPQPLRSTAATVPLLLQHAALPINTGSLVTPHSTLAASERRPPRDRADVGWLWHHISGGADDWRDQRRRRLQPRHHAAATGAAARAAH
eukprot:360999-Chlamydomonas_euryale.AAC.3